MTVVTPASATARPLAADRHGHVVDQLIAERAPRLTGSAVWPLVRPALYGLLDYAKARRMAEAIALLSGRAALEHVAQLLRLKVEASGLGALPPLGRVIVVCNHPTGIADGMAVYEALKGPRPDLAFYANSDALRVSPGLADVLIPVEWVAARRTRERNRATLQATVDVLEAERCLVVFPSGRLSRRQPDGRLADPPWASSPVSLARRYEAPILPIHVAGPWSRLFHLFNRVSPELRDITLFHEFLNKEGGRFVLTAGPLIPPGDLVGDAGALTETLKAHVEQALPLDARARFR